MASASNEPRSTTRGFARRRTVRGFAAGSAGWFRLPGTSPEHPTAAGHARIPTAHLRLGFYSQSDMEESNFRQLQPMAGIVTRLQRQEIEMAKYAHAGASRDV